MKNLKKLIAVVLTFALVFSAMAVGFAATTPFTDVKSDAPYASAVARLYALNITNGNTDGTYGVDQPVTRAMMTVFVNRLSGYRNLAEMAKNDTPAFKDVSKNYWAVGDINLAAKLGLTHGVGNGMFDPEGKVTYAQALGFMLNALGYKNLSWPYGVVAKAQDLGLTAGLNLAYNDVITRGDLALIMNKALDQQMVTSYDTNGNPVLGNKLISKVADVNTYLIVATPDVDSSVPAGQVSVLAADSNGKYTVPMTINAGAVDFNKYLGEVVTVYSAKFGNPLSVDVVTTDIKSFTATTYPQATSDGYYFTDASVYARNNAVVVIDGIKTTLSSVYKAIDNGSKVTLINNDGGNGYNYVIVTGATAGVDPYIVKNNVVSGAKYIDNAYALADSLGNAYKVEGAVTKATDIKAGDVIYYLPSASPSLPVIYVVRNTVTGTVSQISVSGSTTTATINGTAYTVNTLKATVNPGDQGTATLDKNNTIIAWTPVSTVTTVTTNYGVVSDSQAPFSQFATKIALAKTDGTTAIYDVVYANVYSVNNTAGKVYSGVAKNDIVSYTVNSNGQIDSLSTVVPAGTSYTTKAFDTTNISSNVLKIGGTNYYVSPSTVILNATVDSSYKASAIAPVKLSDLQSDNYNVLKLSADQYNNLSLLILANATFTTTQTVKPVVYVTGYSRVTTSTSTYTVLNVLENGVAKTYNATSDLGAVANGVYELTLDNNGNVTTATAVTTTNNSKTTEQLLASSVNVTIDYTNNGIKYTASGTTYSNLLDPNVVVIDATGTTPVVTGLANISTSAKVDLYTNSLGKVNLIVIHN
ncbi:S-layer homology domain-containing protein [Thermoanaerobacter thermohydrosulfuricus]|uniref:S-layer domain containing protein n=1 Tax=Thermoanaerobacter thermohydrosulfuricus WC1 TaxID=1198630 RepID=M8CZS1_THETY|nr:S-layer homology domain-containing protein [Thermoanaerobacter thermohydrosulfuricus]EMT39824.1 S-layer domain containing protein [Thermoanaerobacter thermohydrosulfuricus WC1]